MIRTELKELVEAVGGKAGLLMLLEQFYSRMSNDLMIGFFFRDKDLTLIVSHQAEFILNSAGLPSNFTGKGPAQAHTLLPPILAGHFDRRLVILREVLREANVDQKWIDRWVAFEELFRGLVVSQ